MIFSIDGRLFEGALVRGFTVKARYKKLFICQNSN